MMREKKYMVWLFRRRYRPFKRFDKKRNTDKCNLKKKYTAASTGLLASLTIHETRVSRYSQAKTRRSRQKYILSVVMTVHISKILLYPGGIYTTGIPLPEVKQYPLSLDPSYEDKTLTFDLSCTISYLRVMNTAPGLSA